MNTLIVALGLAFMSFGVFITIIHFRRKSKEPDKFPPQMDWTEIDVIATLRFFFKELKKR